MITLADSDPSCATTPPMLDEAEQELKKGQTTQASNNCWHIYCSHFLSVRVEHFSRRRLWPVFCITRKRMLLMDLVVYTKDFKSIGNFTRRTQELIDLEFIIRFSCLSVHVSVRVPHFSNSSSYALKAHCQRIITQREISWWFYSIH